MKNLLLGLLTLSSINVFAQVGDDLVGDYSSKNLSKDFATMAETFRFANDGECYQALKSQISAAKAHKMVVMMVENADLYTNTFNKTTQVSPEVGKALYTDWLISFQILNTFADTSMNANRFNKSFCQSQYQRDIYANNFGLISWALQIK